MKSKTNKPKILIYDIETTPLLAWLWRPGKQVVRHGQLHPDHNMWNIICIAYCWFDGGPVHTLEWDYKKQDSSKMVAEFDKIIAQADQTIGKNSDRFDVKHINSQRLLHDLPPMPEWVTQTDDLEKQMRKFFALPSQGLDYFSSLMGFGGKTKMQFSDWTDIMLQNANGEKSQRKMTRYCKKDVADTRALMKKIWPHVKPRMNMNTFINDGVRRCTHCGSDQLIKNGTRVGGQTIFQHFRCKKHGGYAGKASISNKGKIGKMSV